MIRIPNVQVGQNWKDKVHERLIRLIVGKRRSVIMNLTLEHNPEYLYSIGILAPNNDLLCANVKFQCCGILIKGMKIDDRT